MHGNPFGQVARRSPRCGGRILLALCGAPRLPSPRSCAVASAGLCAISLRTVARVAASTLVLAGLQAGIAETQAAHTADHARSQHRIATGRSQVGRPRHSLTQQVTALIGQPEVQRAHWGVAVSAMDGTPLFALSEGQFFQPASNTKLFTTAAAMARLGAESTLETKVIARGVLGEDGSTLAGDLLLVGAGDATLSGQELPHVAPPERAAPLPARTVPPPGPDPLRSLTALADQVAATGLKTVAGDVIGDDTLWPYEPYPEDWALDDTVWGYGAPVSALSVADNQVRLTVTPSVVVGGAAAVVLEEAVPYYTVESQVTTAAAKSVADGVQVERLPGSRMLRVYGAINTDAPGDVEEIAIADPAEYAAMALKVLLEARGVRVQGTARALHRPATEHRGFGEIARLPLPFVSTAATTTASASSGRDAACAGKALPVPVGSTAEGGTGGVARSAATGPGCAEAGSPGAERVLATRRSVPLAEDVVLTNKVSQNLHAELMQRRLGAAWGEAGSAAQGARVVRAFLLEAGLDPEDFVFYDGSGLSGHDLVTPRAVVRLLTYAGAQPWFEVWKGSLPVGGVDGSLRARFGEKSGLKDRVFAKTGTLGEARALSGYLVAASGRTVAFSVMVTDHAPRGSKDREVMDGIVEAIAAAE